MDDTQYIDAIIHKDRQTHKPPAFPEARRLAVLAEFSRHKQADRAPLVTLWRELLEVAQEFLRPVAAVSMAGAILLGVGLGFWGEVTRLGPGDRLNEEQEFLLYAQDIWSDFEAFGEEG